MKTTRYLLTVGLTALAGFALPSNVRAQDCPNCGTVHHGVGHGMIRNGAAAIHSGAGGTAGYHTHGEALNWVSHSTWGDYWARNQAAQRPWHGEYYYLKTGQPTALIVHLRLSCNKITRGVSRRTRWTPVYHQFGGGPASGGTGGNSRPLHTGQAIPINSEFIQYVDLGNEVSLSWPQPSCL